MTSTPADLGLERSTDRWSGPPDGLLHLVPFPQLAPARRLSTVPSVTLLQRWRQTPESAAPAALAFADPKLGEQDDEQYRAATERLADLEGEAELGRLPQAREEGCRLVRRLGGTSRLLVDAEATEEALKSARLGSATTESSTSPATPCSTERNEKARGPYKVAQAK